jgi:hypothetical protein
LVRASKSVVAASDKRGAVMKRAASVTWRGFIETDVSAGESAAEGT